eukprot:5988142-Pyramimonas_sp.AAC.1
MGVGEPWAWEGVSHAEPLSPTAPPPSPIPPRHISPEGAVLCVRTWVREPAALRLKGAARGPAPCIQGAVRAQRTGWGH